MARASMHYGRTLQVSWMGSLFAAVSKVIVLNLSAGTDRGEYSVV